MVTIILATRAPNSTDSERDPREMHYVFEIGEFLNVLKRKKRESIIK